MKDYFVYIMTNRSGTLYTGLTSDLERRVYQHKHKLIPGFTSRYRINKLIFYEMTSNVEAAIAREKQIKGWLRKKKLALVATINAEWRDLSDDWMR